MGFLRLDVAHIFFPHAHLLMTERTRVPLALLPAPFLANLASLSWGWAFLEVPWRSTGKGDVSGGGSFGRFRLRFGTIVCKLLFKGQKSDQRSFLDLPSV